MSPSLSKADHYIAWNILNLFDLTPTASTNFAKTFTFVQFLHLYFCYQLPSNLAQYYLALGKKWKCKLTILQNIPRRAMKRSPTVATDASTPVIGQAV